MAAWADARSDPGDFIIETSDQRPRVCIPRTSISLDALAKKTGRTKSYYAREAILRQIQQILHERVRFAPIFEFLWPSGIGPRVEEPALMLINPYPWSAPLEEVRLKKK